MSDEGKRSPDDPKDEGWEPPWSFGIEGEPVETPAWEFTEPEAVGDAATEIRAPVDSEITTASGSGAGEVSKSPRVVTEIEESSPAAADAPKEPLTIESRASRVQWVETPEQSEYPEDPRDLSIGPIGGRPTSDSILENANREEELLHFRNLPASQREALKKRFDPPKPKAQPEPRDQTIEAVEPPPESVENDATDAESVAVAPEAAPAESPRIESVSPDLPLDPAPGDLEMMIEFEDVTKRFRNQTVLRNLTFRIPRGQTVCLIGESGCGKTVNLKLMIGLIRPDKGRVAFKGEDLSRMNEKKITATRIKFGFLFQMAALFDSMSIYDNVAFGLREHRLVDEKDLPDYIRERLTEVGLPPGVESKKPAELSGGQRKRVGLARALALKPEVMLYDEPTTGLDPIMTDIINELILQTQADKTRSGIIVTHEMRTVSKCADRVIMLYPISRLEPDEPQILYDGPAAGLEDHPDPRVRQFVRGEAGERLRELNPDRLGEDPATGIVPMDPDDIMKARPPRTRD